MHVHIGAPSKATADVSTARGAERGVIAAEEARSPRGRERGGGGSAEHE